MTGGDRVFAGAITESLTHPSDKLGFWIPHTALFHEGWPLSLNSPVRKRPLTHLKAFGALFARQVFFWPVHWNGPSTFVTALWRWWLAK